MFQLTTGHVLATIATGTAAVLLTSAPSGAALVDFTYTQNDSTTGAGSISAFTYTADPGGPINFSPTALPAASVVNPNPGTTPVGFVGSIDAQAGAGNETNEAVGLIFSGVVTAVGTRGADTFTLQIPLVFVPKQTQAPDTSDYNWNIAYGDTASVDAVSSASLRMATWLSRDTVADAVETANMFQRFTQDNKNFVAGLDSFTNTTTTTTAVKDAEDPAGAPLGSDAVGRDLSIYFGWRDQGGLTSGNVVVDSFQFGGLLQTNDATLTRVVVPEPSTLGVVGALGALGLVNDRRRRRRRNG
jgi:hypothetical protein